MSIKLNDLLPIVQQKATEFKNKCNLQGLDFLVTCTYRTIKEQDALYAQGRTTQGQIVTNAHGGQSLHNWHCAFDIVPLVNGKPVWDNNALWAKFGSIGQSVGLEWGGSWATIIDRPHFQYTLGYTWQDFQSGKADLTKFNIKTMDNSTASPMTPAEEVGTTGNAVIFHIINKATGEEVPHVTQGSNHEGNFFVTLADGTEVTFVGENKENDTYSVTTS